MHIAILGRQPALSVAELERLYGTHAVRWFSEQAALVDSPNFNFEILGGSQKAGKVIFELNHRNWLAASRKIVQHYTGKWQAREHKITLGISVYDFNISPRDVQKTGLIIKKKLRETNTSLRLIPNASLALNTATSHHNKLGLSPNKIELLIVRASNGRVIVAESIGAQNITALAARDQARPRTDAFVGMLPPKLARIMLNMTGAAKHSLILDPFCGTGTVLQEALLDGYSVIGSDLSQKMVDYSSENLAWLQKEFNTPGKIISVHQADATSHHWDSIGNAGAIVCETYLGQPFSAPPEANKLKSVRDNCNHIISQFLTNIRPQISPKTTLVIAVPAWRDQSSNFTHLPLIKQLPDLGYRRVSLNLVNDNQLLYYRENQVVARELLILKTL